MIYLDNAATSWPKPPAVLEAMALALGEAGGNPGRSGHGLAVGASRLIAGTRAACAECFGAASPDRVVFGPNATWAINLALKGLLKAGDHVVTGSMEHNAVTRPLNALEARGVTVARARTSPLTGLDPDEVRRAITPATRLVVTALASNVSGTINPIGAIGALCREYGILLLVDAAQGAGSLAIDMGSMRIDLLAFPGHKGLLGPQGTGGLCLAPGLEPEPLVEGGTGVDSRSPRQPATSPERHESGTPNTPGIAGLGAALRFLTAAGTGPDAAWKNVTARLNTAARPGATASAIEAIAASEAALCERLQRGLLEIPGLTVHGPPPGAARASVLSLNLRGLDPLDMAAILEGSFGIAARAGLHCAPEAHAVLGTLETGTLRLSPGYFTTAEEIDACVRAVAAIAKGAAA